MDYTRQHTQSQKLLFLLHSAHLHTAALNSIMCLTCHTFKTSHTYAHTHRNMHACKHTHTHTHEKFSKHVKSKVSSLTVFFSPLKSLEVSFAA